MDWKKRSVFIATLAVVFNSATFCFAEKKDSSQPLLVLNKTAKPPKIDGQLDDECWKSSSGSALLPNISNKKLSDKTWFLMTYDEHNLYFAFYGEQQFLKPVLNMLDKVKVHSAKHDASLIKYDDVFGINLLDEKTYSNYTFKVNMKGITWDKKNKLRDWDSGMKAAAMTHKKGYWVAEIMVPFKALGIKKIHSGIKLRMNVFRDNVPAGEITTWNPTQGRLNNFKKLGIVKLSEKSPIIQCKDIHKKSHDALIEMSVKSPFAALLKDSNHSLEISMDKLQKINFEITPDKNNRGQMILEGNGKIFFRTPVIKLNSSVYPLNAKIENPGGKIEAFFNGKRIASKEDKLSLDLKVVENKNVLCFRFTPGKQAPLGKISIAGKELSLKKFLFAYSSSADWKNPKFSDWKWKLYNGERLKEAACFRFNIVQNHTMFAPLLPENKLYVANQAPMRIGFRLCSPFKHSALNSVIHLEVPKGIRIPVHDIVNRGYTSCWHKLKRQKKNGVIDYQFAFSSQIKNQPHAFSSRTLHIYIDPEFSESQVGKTLPGSFYIEGKGFLEIPRTLKIKVLPKLNGRQPKNIILSSWFGMNNYLYSFSELKELMKTLKPMGINVMGITYKLAPRMPAFFEDANQGAIAELANKYNIRTISYNYAYEDSKFLYDIHLKCPHWSKIATDGKPKNSTWIHHICPLAFMKSKEVKKRIQKLASVHDGIGYDLEAGIWASCLCESCRKDMMEKFELEKLPSRKDVMKPEMRDIWTKHQVKMNKRVYDFIMNSAKEIKPSIKTAVYSGGATTSPACYGMDWTLFKGQVDYPMSGYQEDAKVMAKTRKALGNSPYIAGLFIGNKQFAQENGDQEITARCFYQLSAGGYLGILLWNNMHLDGRGMQAFAEFSKGVTRFESYLRDDLKLKDGSKYVKGLPQDCVHIFRNKGKLLYLLINRSGIERKISFAIPEEIFKAPEAFDFYVNKTFSPRKPWNEYSIPANKARLIEIKGKTSF